MSSKFDILLLLARPAAGKSEIIDHLAKTSLEERIARFHIGAFDVIDDFPMLWTWFEEDDLLSSMGRPRLHTDENGYFKWHYLWDLLIERINLDYEKKTRETTDYHIQKTTIIEFARGTEHGGFSRAFDYLSRSILEKSGVLYINVSWQESLRKNRVRFNPDRPYSILEHGLPDEKLNRLYRYVDWDELTKGDDNFIQIKGELVPYSVFDNEDDVTTGKGEDLLTRLEISLNRLWNIYLQKVNTGNDLQRDNNSC